MIIKNRAGATISTVTPSAQSTRTRTITGMNIVTLIFSLPTFVDFPAGTNILFDGSTYTTRKPGAFVKNAVRSYQYTLTLESEAANLAKYKIRDISTGHLKFSLTATPAEFAAVIVANMNTRESGWTVGTCVTSTEKTVTFSHTSLLEAIASVSEAFKTEWEVVGKAISLRKVEYYKDAAQELSYGYGNGFKTGVKRENFDNAQPIEKLLVQGGDRNIDKSKYPSSELLLPVDYVTHVVQSIAFDGTYFDDEVGYIAAGAITYDVDAAGLAITIHGATPLTNEETSLDLSDIYPKRVGTVTSVDPVNPETNLYDIIDTNIPSTLDYNDYQIAGENMTIIFQTGELAGREFDCNYIDADQRFEIIPATLDGIEMPGGDDGMIYLPAINDEYAIFGISMPAAYICDNTTKTGASWDMLREAVRYFHESKDPRFTFTGDLDQQWLATNYGTVGPKLIPGGYIAFSDLQFQESPVLIRIATITDNINNKAKATLDLSNVNPVTGLVKNQLVKINTNPVVAVIDTKKATNYFKRRFRDAVETAVALEQALLDFSGSINPIAVTTMQIIAGDKTLQFRFVDDKTTPVEVAHTFIYTPATKTLATALGIIQHMTFGITTLSSTHPVADYHFWDMEAYSQVILNETIGGYLYAKCSTTTEAGEFYYSTTPIGILDDAGFYYFLVGYLNSQSDGDRSWARFYGYTEILPGQIAVDRVTSSDGLSYFDMLSRRLYMGDHLDYDDAEKAIDINVGGSIFRMKGLDVDNSLLSNNVFNGGIRIVNEALDEAVTFSVDADGNTALANIDGTTPANFSASGEISAYGIIIGGGGGGLVTNVYNSGNLGDTFDDAVVADTFNAFTIKAINTKAAAAYGWGDHAGLYDDLGAAALVTPTTLGLVIGVNVLAQRTFGTAADSSTSDFIASSLKGSVNGVAELDANGFVKNTQLPSYVDDVLEYANLAALPATGESGKIYITADTNVTYRWSGTAYAEISASLALGETSATAYRGDRGKTAYDHIGTSGAAHGNSSADVAGFMSAAQYTKLAGIAESANNYTHPTYSATPTTSAASPAHGGTFTAIDSLTYTNGHLTGLNTKTITLPAAYSHPDYSIETGIGGTLGHIKASERTAWNAKYDSANSNLSTVDWTAKGLAANFLTLSNGSGYLTIQGLTSEVQINLFTEASTSGLRHWRIGKTAVSNALAIQVLNDTNTSVDYTPFSVNYLGAATFSSTISATTAILSNLTAGYLPYHTAGGLVNSGIWTNVTFTGIGYTADPTSGNKFAVNGQMYVNGTITTVDRLRLHRTTGINYIDYNNANNLVIRSITAADEAGIDAMVLTPAGAATFMSDVTSNGEVSAYGIGIGGGTGLVQNVYDSGDLAHGTFYDATLTDTFNAYAINGINDAVINIVSGTQYFTGAKAFSDGLSSTAILPTGSGTENIGADDQYWSNLYCVAGHFTGAVSVGGALGVTGAATFAGEVSVPEGENTYSAVNLGQMNTRLATKVPYAHVTDVTVAMMDTFTSPGEYDCETLSPPYNLVNGAREFRLTVATFYYSSANILQTQYHPTGAVYERFHNDSSWGAWSQIAGFNMSSYAAESHNHDTAYAALAGLSTQAFSASAITATSVALSAGISTGGNATDATLKFDVVTKILDSDNVSNRYAYTAWTKATPANVVFVSAGVYDGSGTYFGFMQQGTGAADTAMGYDCQIYGGTVSVYPNVDAEWSSGATIRIFIVYK